VVERLTPPFASETRRLAEGYKRFAGFDWTRTAPGVHDAGMEQASAKPALDLGRCLNDAIDVYKRNFVTFAIASVLVSLMSFFSVFVLAGPLLGGALLMSLNALRDPDRKANIGDLFATFNHRFGPLVGLFFVTVIPIVLGYLLLIAPGVLLLALWLFPFFLVIDQNMSVLDALSTSCRIVLRRGLWINVACAFMIFVLTMGASWMPAIGLIAGLLLAPLAWLINTSAYVQEVKEYSDFADFAPRGFPLGPMPGVTPTPAT
jgi:hypothetical protein